VTEAVSEALRMIDTFASVGTNKAHVTKTDINGIVQWGKAYSLEGLRKRLPAMIRFAGKLEECDLLDKTGNAIGKARAGGNLMVRPMSDSAAFIQLDDLTEAKLDRVRPVAFLTVRTSPGNYQAWIAIPKFASDQERKDFTRRVKKQVSADSSATGSVRLAGTSNFPEDPARTVVRFKTSGNHSRLETGRSWPDYERCLLAAPPASDGDGPSRSHADFTWCMMAAQRGHSIEDIANKLLEVSAKAQERARLHDEGYALVTARNASDAAERGRKRGRG
jgi:DNA primase RepB-like protein